MNAHLRKSSSVEQRLERKILENAVYSCDGCYKYLPAADELQYCLDHKKYTCYKCIYENHRRCTLITSASQGATCVQLAKNQLANVSKSLLKLGREEIERLQALTSDLEQLEAKLRVLHKTITERLDVVENSCEKIQDLLQESLQNPSKAALIVVSDELTKQWETEKLSNELTKTDATISSFYALACADLNAPDSLLSIASKRRGKIEIVESTIKMKEQTKPFDEYGKRIITIINEAIRCSIQIDEIPQAVVTVLKNAFVNYDWHAFVSLDGVAYTPPLAVQANLRGGTYFGVGYRDAGTLDMAIDDQEILDFVRQKGKQQNLNKQSLRTLAGEASAMFGGLWSCICGKPGTVVAACNTGDQQGVTCRIGELDFVLFRYM